MNIHSWLTIKTLARTISKLEGAAKILGFGLLVAGAVGCGPTDALVGGACLPEYPTCGSTCCASGDSCVEGVCVAPTDETLADAGRNTTELHPFGLDGGRDASDGGRDASDDASEDAGGPSCTMP